MLGVLRLLLVFSSDFRAGGGFRGSPVSALGWPTGSVSAGEFGGGFPVAGDFRSPESRRKFLSSLFLAQSLPSSPLVLLLSSSNLR